MRKPRDRRVGLGARAPKKGEKREREIKVYRKEKTKMIIKEEERINGR